MPKKVGCALHNFCIFSPEIFPSKCQPDDARIGDKARQGAFGVEPSCGLPVPLPHLEAGERARRGSGQSLDLQAGEGTIVGSVIKAISVEGGVAWQIGCLVKFGAIILRDDD